MTNLNHKDSNTELLLQLIENRLGHSTENGQRDRLLDKVTPLVLERGLDSFLDYYYLLRYDEDSESEWRRVETALAVNETYFWREVDQLRVATEILIPQIQAMRPGSPVRIWHAACATGEEPYTMAIALTEASVYFNGPVEIFATDFNQEAIALARAAVYRGRSFRSIPDRILNRYFLPLQNGNYRLVDSIRNRVQFAHVNLLDVEGMRRIAHIDIIFCRNAFIYFTRAAIAQTAEFFYQSLRSPGYLFLAASESLLRVNTQFELDEIGGAFVYRK